MKRKNSFKQLIEEAKQHDSYWVGKAIHEFTEDLYRLMEERGVSQSELARRIGSSPAYITKVLRGDTNFTIESMVRLVRALDGRFHTHVAKSENKVRWFDVVGKSGAVYETREYARVHGYGVAEKGESYETTLAA